MIIKDNNKIEKINVSEVYENAHNPRNITKEALDKLKKSIEDLPEMLYLRPLVINKENIVLGGNMRLRAVKELGYYEIPVIRVEDLTEEQQEQFIIKDNLAYGEWDWEVLKAEWEVDLLDDWGLELEIKDEGTQVKGGTRYEQTEDMGLLTDRFVVPPFSILDTRQGYWQERKKAWRRLIKDFGESRESVLTGDNMSDNILNNIGAVSLIDPVLVESLITWFAPNRAKVFDIMTGDSVEGFISNYKGHSFTGIEIREDQVRVNKENTKGMSCEYICDDARNVLNHIDEGTQDLLITCPPYFDLEVYSDLPNDASNQESYEEFYSILDDSLRKSIKCLKDNRFACIIIGDIRGNDDSYYDLPGDIIRTFRESGMVLYNKAVLVDMAGTLPVRVGRYMDSRKLGKQHQDILVFYKGNPKDIKQHFDRIKDIDYELGDE